MLAEWEGLGFPSAELGESLDAVCERLGVNTDHNLPSRRDELLRRGLDALGWHVDAMPRNVPRLRAGSRLRLLRLRLPARRQAVDAANVARGRGGAGARIVVGAKARRVYVENGAAAGVDAGPVQVRSRAVVAAGRGDRDAGAPAPLRPPQPERRPVAAAPSGDRRLRHLRRGGRPWEGTLQALYSDRYRFLDDGYGVKYETIPAHPALLSSALPWESAADNARLMSSLARLSLVAVIPRDSGSGRVRLGRDGEAIVTYALGADDARRLATGIDGAGRILAAAGAREIVTAHARAQRWDDGFPPDAFRFGPGRGSLFSFHLMGSARMGGSPRTSAADPAGETWEVQNLVVADGSAFPTASGVNPMITIEAIAHLNAVRLAARL